MLATLLLCGCSQPSQTPEALAADHHLVSDVVRGSTFEHQVFRNHALLEGALHVYIEGDGRPHPAPSTVAADPTPRTPLMLELMLLDESASVYVGRPCYFRVRDANCHPRYWTLRRYSPEIIDSMQRAVEAEMLRANATEIVLFAHSGGATLAWALASRMKSARRVVTLAGNLDVPAWTRLHGFTQLEDAFNPASIPITRPGFTAIHYAGGQDRVIPPALVREGAKQSGGELREMPDYAHHCCWKKLWPTVLREADR